MMRLILIAFSMLCCLAMLVKHSDAEIDPTTAVAVWLFNEAGGDTASDSSENGNDGTLMGDPNGSPMANLAMPWNWMVQAIMSASPTIKLWIPKSVRHSQLSSGL